ncbi:MAG TPA: hypothetical protein VIX19_05645 [Terriglobales bacterium]
MDPFARKMILSSVAFGIVMALMTGALSVVYFHERPRCNEQVLAESTVRDHQWTAATLERRCGEDSPFLVHVNVRPTTTPIRLGYFSGEVTQGEVFVAEQDSPDVVPDLKWTGPAALTIRCTGCRAGSVHKRLDHIGAVAVRYELGP